MERDIGSDNQLGKDEFAGISYISRSSIGCLPGIILKNASLVSLSLCTFDTSSGVCNRTGKSFLVIPRQTDRANSKLRSERKQYNKILKRLPSE